jgi:hypothetical protein
MRLKLHCHILPIPQRELDFDASVADTIAQQLSLGVEDSISLWNHKGAPNLEQFQAFLDSTVYALLTEEQRNNIDIWRRKKEIK